MNGRLHQHDGASTHAEQAVPVEEAVQEALNQSTPAVHDAGRPPPQPEKQDGVQGRAVLPHQQRQ